jgi:hypothetical protein
MLLCYQSSFFSFFLFSRHVYDEKSLPVMLNTNHQDAWTLFGIQPQHSEHSTFQSTEMGTPFCLTTPRNVPVYNAAGKCLQHVVKLSCKRPFPVGSKTVRHGGIFEVVSDDSV